MRVARESRSWCMIWLAATLGIDSSTSGMSVLTVLAGTAGVKVCNGVALRGTSSSPGVTPRARSLGRYTLPPRRRVDIQHLPRRGATDAASSVTPTGPTAFLPVSYTHLRAHETRHDLVCRLLLEKK